VVSFENILVKDGSEEFREEVTRVEEFGIAHDVRPILEWKPSILDGKSLREFFKVT
jgi:hypothetical protein